MSDYTPYDAYTMRKCIERQDATIARLQKTLDSAWSFRDAAIRAQKVLEAENASLREENQSLLDCLNGSSKAVYTAEMYDALRARVEELERDRLALSDENARLNEALGEAEAKVEKVREWLNGSIINSCPECGQEIGIIDWNALQILI